MARKTTIPDRILCNGKVQLIKVTHNSTERNQLLRIQIVNLKEQIYQKRIFAYFTSTLKLSKKTSVLSLFVIISIILLTVSCNAHIENFQKKVSNGVSNAANSTPSLQASPTISIDSLLPGQQRWKNGVSSFLFGTNNTQEWSTDNIETDPHKIIQPSLKAAGLTLMRSFFFHHSLADNHRTSMAEIETRLKTIENSGMVCLGVIPGIRTDPSNPGSDPIGDTDFDFAKKVVAYAGNRCNLYEIGNEPDIGDDQLTIQQYLQKWNEFVPALRAINPNAKFIGPVTYNDQGNHCTYGNGQAYCFMRKFLQGVKASGVLPDAVSFHWYPCSTDNPKACLEQASSYATVTNEVKGWVHTDLGKDVPVGITEWNMDSGNNSVLGNNSRFMYNFTIAALKQMISSHLDFANQFAAQDYSGYGALDMFDSNKNDQPKAQFNAIKYLISLYKP
jgi:hypothetical protein